jgi:hypothetical protein
MKYQRQEDFINKSLMALEMQGEEATSGDDLGGRVPRWYMVSHGKRYGVCMSIFYFILFYFIVFTFTYMCIHYLGHLQPLLTLLPGRNCSALLFSNFVEEKTQVIIRT